MLTLRLSVMLVEVNRQSVVLAEVDRLSVVLRAVDDEEDEEGPLI